MRKDRRKAISRYIFLVIILWTLVLALPATGAQEGDSSGDSGVLHGTVFNLHYDSPVPHAYVLVESEVGYVEARSTNSEGEYKFNLPYGTYKLRAFVQDQEMHNATGIFVDPSPVVHDIFMSFAYDEPVRLHGVIKLGGDKANQMMVVFEGTENSYMNETITGKDGSYALDVPFGTYSVTAFEDGEDVGVEEIGPFITTGDQESNIDIEYTGDTPSIGEVSSFLIGTWTGMAIWGAVVFGLVFAYFVLNRKLKAWVYGRELGYSDELLDLIIYAIKGYTAVGFLHTSLLVLDAVLDITDDVVSTFIGFWLLAFEIVLVLWVTARLIIMLIDYMMIRLRKMKVKEGSEIPETAYIFIHGLLRYLVLAIFGFFILLTILSGLGLYDEIAGGASGFVDSNFGYLTLIIIIVILYYITNRFVKLVFSQMSDTSTRFTPQMLRTFGFITKIAIIGLFSVLIIFTLLTMAGMQEMGALIMALLTTSIGMIVAMTTTGAIGNALSGMVIMTLKPLKPNQWVEVANGHFGYVLDIGTFFTKLKTFNNEIIEIPNNLILSQEIKNFSKRKNIGIEIDFGIGYDIPADIILNLMKKGAKGTRNIVKDPKPAAMITSFGDYAIQYKLRAFTDKVDQYFPTKSTLMENLQEIFYEEGIEIMTPWQLVKREEGTPSREEVVRKYADNMKHKEADGETVAAGLDMLDGNSKEC